MAFIEQIAVVYSTQFGGGIRQPSAFFVFKVFFCYIHMCSVKCVQYALVVQWIEQNSSKVLM